MHSVTLFLVGFVPAQPALRICDSLTALARGSWHRLHRVVSDLALGRGEECLRRLLGRVHLLCLEGFLLVQKSLGAQVGVALRRFIAGFHD